MAIGVKSPGMSNGMLFSTARTAAAVASTVRRVRAEAFMTCFLSPRSEGPVPLSARGARLQFCERHQDPGNRARRDRGRTGQPDLPRPGTAREIAVDRADGDLFALGRRAGATVGAGTARGLQDLRADRFEGVEVAALAAVV